MTVTSCNDGSRASGDPPDHVPFRRRWGWPTSTRLANAKGICQPGLARRLWGDEAGKPRGRADLPTRGEGSGRRWQVLEAKQRRRARPCDELKRPAEISQRFFLRNSRARSWAIERNEFSRFSQFSILGNRKSPRRECRKTRLVRRDLTSALPGTAAGRPLRYNDGHGEDAATGHGRRRRPAR